MHTGTIDLSRFPKRAADGLFAVMVSLAAAPGCKCNSSSTSDAPAALGSANSQSNSDRVLLVLDGSAVTFEIEETRLAIHHGTNTVYFRGG